MSIRCSLVLRPAGNGTPPRSTLVTCSWPAIASLAEGFEGASDHLLVGDEDLGLVQRNAERLGIGNLRTDQAHLVGQMLGRAAERDDVALLQHEVGSAPSCSPPRTTLTMRYSGLVLRKLGNGLADLGRIFQPVGAQAERPVTR